MIVSDLHYINVRNFYHTLECSETIRFNDWLKLQKATYTWDGVGWIVFETEEDLLMFKLKYTVPEILITK